MTVTTQTNEIIEFKLQPALAECALHRQRLHQAWLGGSESRALNQTSPTSLSDEEIRTFDQRY